jgi:hypothetical protein
MRHISTDLYPVTVVSTELHLTFKDVNLLADHDKKPDEENGCPNCRPRPFNDRPEHKHVHTKRKSVQLRNTVLTWHEGLRHSVAGALNAQIYMYFLNVQSPTAFNTTVS